MNYRRYAGCGLAALAAALLAGPAIAQDAVSAEEQQREAQEAEGEEAEAAEESGEGRQTIVVTAQRRAQALADVPLALQAFTGDELEETGYRDLREIITLVPGASEGRGNAAGIRSYQIRGVSSFYGDSTIGYYLDEAAYVIPNRNYAPVARSFDIDRVEVLRGPQGTLYGLGSMGGTIRFLTADPDLDSFRARGDVGLSDTGEGGEMNYYGDLAVSVPLIPGAVAVRGVASYERRGGFAQSPSFPGDWNDTTFQNYRVKLLAKPTADLTVKLGAHRNITEDDWGQNLQSVDPARFFPSRVPGRNRQVYNMYTGSLAYDFGPVVVESSTGYIERTDSAVGPIVFIGGPPGALPPALTVRGESESFVQEVRAVSQGSGPLQWVVGGIYQDAESLEDIVVQFGPPISAASVYDSKSWAVFGELSYGLFNDTLRPLVGLRYFEDDREFFSQNRPPGPVLPPPFVTGAKFDALSPRFNLSWEPNKDILLYANVAKGFRSGTFNNAAAVAVSGGQVGFAVEPDKIWSYEIGGKFTFGRGLFLELVAYKFDWTDIQLNYTVAGGVQVIRNAGDVDGKGFEWVLNWEAVPGLTLQSSGNVNSTEFVNIVNPAAFAGTPNIAVGKQLATVPDFTASFGATYQGRSGIAGADLFLNAMYSYIAEQGDTGDPLGRLGDDHDLLRARAGLKWDKFGIFLFGENLLGDKDPIQISGSGITRYYPRVIGLELSFDF
ncbi:MAG: TonB-dependent receptor [Allosphingosinicella sp.]